MDRATEKSATVSENVGAESADGPPKAPQDKQKARRSDILQGNWTRVRSPCFSSPKAMRAL